MQRPWSQPVELEGGSRCAGCILSQFTPCKSKCSLHTGSLHPVSGGRLERAWHYPCFCPLQKNQPYLHGFACYVKEQVGPAHDALFFLSITTSALLLPVFSDGSRASYDLDCFITTQVSRAPGWALCIWVPWLCEEKHSAALLGRSCLT